LKLTKLEQALGNHDNTRELGETLADRGVKILPVQRTDRSVEQHNIAQQRLQLREIFAICNS
jgi:hypothetical protein